MVFGCCRKKPAVESNDKNIEKSSNQIGVVRPPQKRRYVRKNKRKCGGRKKKRKCGQKKKRKCGRKKKPRRKAVQSNCYYRLETNCREYSDIRSYQYPSIIVEALKKCELGVSISQILQHFATKYGLTCIRHKVDRALDWMKQKKIVVEHTYGVWKLKNCPKCDCWKPPTCKYRPSPRPQQSCCPMIPPPPKICCTCTPRYVPPCPCKKKKRRRKRRRPRRSKKAPYTVPYSSRGYQPRRNEEKYEIGPFFGIK